MGRGQGDEAQHGQAPGPAVWPQPPHAAPQAGGGGAGKLRGGKDPGVLPDGGLNRASSVPGGQRGQRHPDLPLPRGLPALTAANRPRAPLTSAGLRHHGPAAPPTPPAAARGWEGPRRRPAEGKRVRRGAAALRALGFHQPSKPNAVRACVWRPLYTQIQRYLGLFL